MFQSKLNFLCHCCPNLWYFQASKPWKYQFSLRKINVFQVFAKSMFVRISCIFPSKNHPKTLPKRGPNPSKIDAENVLIFNIDFLRFWPRFGRVLGFQDGAKLAPDLRMQPQNHSRVFFLEAKMANLAPSWKPKTFQNRGRNPKKSMFKNNTFSASIFWGFRPRFARILGRVFEAQTRKNMKTEFFRNP